jgi:hypothetical protein
VAVSFPIALANLADLIPIEHATWNEVRQEDMSPIASGEFLSHDLGPPLWELDVQSPPLPHATIEQCRARLRALDGSSQAFYAYNPLLKYPQSDPAGVILGSSSVVIASINANRKAMTLSGLPAGYVMTVGDYFHVDYGSSPYRRALIQIIEGVTADGSGVTPEFEVRPHLRSGISTTLTVTLKKPAAKVKLLPATLRTEQAEDVTMSRLRFTARQTLGLG